MNPAIAKSLNDICVWLDQTSLSQAIQANSWVVPTVQSVHILAIALVAASALMIDLRLIGLFHADQPLKSVAARFLPFLWWPLIVLLITGAIMIIGEPPRSLKNPAFQFKMALLIGALLVTGIFQIMLRTSPAFAGSSRTGAGVAIAIVSMLLWTGIIFAGRWIAYYS